VRYAATLLGIGYQAFAYIIESRHPELLKQRTPVYLRSRRRYLPTFSRVSSTVNVLNSLDWRAPLDILVNRKSQFGLLTFLLNANNLARLIEGCSSDALGPRTSSFSPKKKIGEVTPRTDRRARYENRIL